MGPTTNLLAALVLTFVSIALCQPTDSAAAFATAEPNGVGFSLELALRDPNLTAMEVIRRSSSIARPCDVEIRPHLHNIEGYYVIRTAIGANPTRVFELLFDTGSDFIWTQCIQCTECFEQNKHAYDPVLSTTCSNITYGHPYCTPPCTCGVNGECLFKDVYGGGQFTAGYMVRERLVLSGRTLKPPVVELPGLLIGCSLRSSRPMFSSPDVDGIMGMDRGDHSFIRQLFRSYRVNVFSHCLIQLFTEARSYIRVGSDVTFPSDAKSIPILPRSRAYRVPLADVTVAGRRLHLPEGAFGMCVMDTGTMTTRVLTGAYNIIKQAVINHFAALSLKQISGQPYALDLCYERPEGFNEFPAMDLHFVHSEGETAMQLDPILHAFVTDHNAFCLAMLPHPRLSIIGSMMMQNFRIVYDLGSARILFAREECDEK